MSYVVALESLLAASVLMTLVLTILVAVRKHRRDRNEAAFAARRERLRRGLLEHDAGEVRTCLREAMFDPTAQVDVAVTLEAVWPQLTGHQIHLLGEAAASTGLVAALGSATTARDPMARGRAVVLISRLRWPTAAGFIAPRLNDPDPDVRLAAAGALGAIADDAAGRALIRALCDEALPAERLIERLGRPWAVDVVLEMLANEGRAGVPRAPYGRSIRAHLATALSLSADPSAEDALLHLLRAGDVEERVAAARALGTCGMFRAVPALQPALTDEAWSVRAQAAKSLGMLGDHVAVGALERALADRAWWVRSNSATALRQLGEPGLEALKRALGANDWYARDRAREALDMAAVAP